MEKEWHFLTFLFTTVKTLHSFVVLEKGSCFFTGWVKKMGIRGLTKPHFDAFYVCTFFLLPKIRDGRHVLAYVARRARTLLAQRAVSWTRDAAAGCQQ